MNDDLLMFFDTLVIQADGEYGYHIYYKDHEKEFSFFADYNKVDILIQDIVDRCKNKRG